MVAFRSVALPANVSGTLYLHSMPGRHESLDAAWAEIKRLGIGTIACLAPAEEIERKSPEYARALAQNTVICNVEHFPITDYSAPENEKAFWSSATKIAGHLRQGRGVLIHCGAGIGRTGTFAIAVLFALGIDSTEARRIVTAAGSSPERSSQDETLRRLEARRKR